MKIRHNKKRNTAFVYESLIREATLCILKNKPMRKDKVIAILKESFPSGSALRQELECYRSLYPQQGMSKLTAARVLRETRQQHDTVDRETLFAEQTSIIDRINAELGRAMFSNFVPNYKTLASISQLFSDKGTPKNKILLENRLINEMATGPNVVDGDSTIDSTVYKVFVKKFNEKYDKQLLPEQKELLTYYVSSFSDNAVSLKIFLNEELARLKSELKAAKAIHEIKTDASMTEKTEKIIARLDSYKSALLGEEVLLTVLKTQQLVREICGDGD